MVSVLMNHLHVYSHLWQTPLPHNSYTFWAIGLACEVIRPHNPQLFLVGAHKEHGLLTKKGKRRNRAAIPAVN